MAASQGSGAREQALEWLLQVVDEHRSLDLVLEAAEGHAQSLGTPIAQFPDVTEAKRGDATANGAPPAGFRGPTTEPDARDRALARELSFGVLRWLERLRSIAVRLLRRPFKSRDLDVELALLIGLYQLDFTRMPPHAAVSSAVALTSYRGKSWARGVINACLRRYQREREAIIAPLAGNPRFEYAHPDWLLDRLATDWPGRYQAILTANQARAPMTLRVNQHQHTTAAYLDHLAADGIAADTGQHASGCLRLTAPLPVDRLPGFRAGWVSVQDEAAQLAGPLLAPGAGARVLDACAAPGGKSTHLLELQPDIAELVCLDASESRLGRLRDGLARVAPERPVTVALGQAQHPEQWWDGHLFDAILLDAPCSATGVIRRHPDIKALRTVDGVAAAAREQREILARLWPLLVPGGRLLYATCSILPAENDAVVQSLLASATDARAAPIEARWGIPTDLGRQILPGGDDDMDGFFYSLIDKRGP